MKRSSMRIISLALAMLMIFGVFAACAKKGVKTAEPIVKENENKTPQTNEGKTNSGSEGNTEEVKPDDSAMEEKPALPEAAAYTGIGMCKLREMSNEPGCNYIVWVGGRRLFKRLKLEEHLEKVWSV